MKYHASITTKETINFLLLGLRFMFNYKTQRI